MKPGYKTTEFWLSLLTMVGSTSATLGQVLDPKWAAITNGVAAAAYAISRGMSKSN